MSKQKTMTPAAIMSRVRWLALSCVVASACLLTADSAVASAPTPAWGIFATSQPTNFVPGEPASYLIKITNVGGSGPTDGSDVTVTDTLPNGLTPTSCGGPCAVSGQTVTWTVTGVFEPGEIGYLITQVEVAPTAEGTVTNTVSVSGGGAQPLSTTEPTAIGSALPFGIASFSAPAIFPDGTPDTQAGGHPYSFTTNISYNTIGSEHLNFLGDPSAISGEVKDLLVVPPLGLIGNPQALPQCTQDEFREQICPPSSQVGVSHINLSGGVTCPHCAGVGPMATGVYNVVPPPGVSAQFAFSYDVGGIHVRTRLNARVDTGGDYGISVVASGISQTGSAVETPVTLWGVPADPSHDDLRCKEILGLEAVCTGPPGTNYGPNPSTAPLKPFLTMPTACPGTPLQTSAEADSWQEPGNFVSKGTTQSAVGGCESLDFTPSLTAYTTAGAADSSSGLSVDLHVPAHEGCKEEAGGGVVCENAEAELKDATVTLPAGLVVDPSSADGLAGCPLLTGKDPVQEAMESKDEISGINLETVYGANCPDASKLGTVVVDSPLVNHPLPGAMYLALQGANPFKSLFAVYLAVDDSATGVVIKLAGKIVLDSKTGQLSLTFDNNPQLPFEDLKVSLFGGTRGALTTPLTCGSYALTTDLTPWSAPQGKDAMPSSEPFKSFTGCVSSEAQAPNGPGFAAGTASPVAGAFSPFVLYLKREDGSQRFSGLSVTLPPGMVGKIAGLEECSQAAIDAAMARTHEGEGAVEMAHPSCPSGSEVGVVHVGAGSGAPYFVTGHAYFAGPYEGAPFSLVIVTPALAGPFDFGTVVVRAALYINPVTAQVTVKSDPFPRILDGVPLDIREVDVEMNRSQFTLNPTSCAAMAVSGEESSTAGNTASLSDRFQAGGCATLPFKPGFTVSTSAKATRANGTSVTFKISYPASALGKEAWLSAAKFEFPKQLPARLSTIQKSCPAATFDANPAACTGPSKIGTAIVHTQLLPVALEGPVYFVSNGNAKFPEAVLVLQGDGVTVDLHSETFINEKTGVTSATLPAIPGVPFEEATVTLPSGQYSEFTANANLCATSKTVTVKKRVILKSKGHKRTVTRKIKQNVTSPLALKMPTVFMGQNGAQITQKTPITVTECPKVVKSKAKTHKLHKKKKSKGKAKKKK